MNTDLKKHRIKDTNQLAKAIVDISTGQDVDLPKPAPKPAKKAKKASEKS
jgi:hypothetical protein